MTERAARYEAAIRACAIVVLALGCVAGMVAATGAEVRHTLQGCLLVLIPASVDATRVAMKEREGRRASLRPGPPVVVEVSREREDTARTRARRRRD